MDAPRDPAEAGTAAPPPAAAMPAPRRGRGRRVALLALALPLLLVALLLAGGAAAWRSLHTEAGTHWWLNQLVTRVPGLRLDTPRGALLGAGSRFTLASAAWDGGATRVRVDALQLDGLKLDRWQWRAPHLRLRAARLEAHRVTVERDPPAEPSAASGAPPSLQLPLTAAIDALRIERLQLPGVAQPVEGLAARLALGDTHRIDDLALRWNGLQAGGSATLGAAAPLTLDTRLTLSGDAQAAPDTLPAWARDVLLELRASGPLQRFDMAATLTAQSQQIDAKAQITPFDALPLAQLDARFAELDLARLLAPFTALAPTTALTGDAVIQLGQDAPLVVSAQADNALPGRWDQQRLPLRRLDVVARGRGNAWEIERAALQLASDARGSVGELNGSGSLDSASGAGTARLALAGVLLQGLDRRAPPLRLSGPVDLQLAARGADGALGRLAFDAQLDGALQGDARARVPAPLRDAVRLALRGSASAADARIDTLSARAGAARVDGNARARRDGAQWVSEADLRLAAFDPALWLPGEPDSLWRRTGNALNGQLALRAHVAADAPDARTLLATLAGTLAAELSDSRLAGQPLALQLEAEADGRGRIDARVDASAAGNSTAIELRLRAPGSAAGGDERLQARIDAPALERLAPLADALGLGPLAGRLSLDGQADGALGAWLLGGASGALTTRGTLEADALQAGTLQLASARGAWQATLPAGDAAGIDAALARALLQGDLALRELRLPGLMLPELALKAEGTLAEHRATLRATLRQPPQPAAGEAAGRSTNGGASTPAPLQLDARLSGAWRGGAAGAASVWRATLEQLMLQPLAAASPADAATPRAPAALPLFVARDLQLTVEQAPQSLRAALAPGRAEVLGAALAWRTANWERSGSAAPQLNLQAEVEPLVMADLLRRLQPDFDWSGDLRVGARIDVRSGAAFVARAEIARTGGDLQLSEFGVVQSLGLSEARLDLVAEAGVWRLTQRIAGANLGRIDGEQSLRTDAARAWPADNAPVEGRLSAQVENLSTWGAWVPAGWRLGGRLDAELQVAGRFGAPELIGTVSGRQLALRNALEGVALSEGTLDARFDGQRAQLSTLRFKAGDGELRASGEAQLGAAPQAQLQLVAERALVLGRVDRRVVASGQAALRFERERITVSGDMRVDEGLIDISRGDAPSLGDDVSVRRAGTATGDDAAAAEAARRTPRAFDLALAVDLGPRLRLRGRGIDTRLAGAMRLSTPNGRLTANGEIRTESGTYEAYGQKLEIERGVITFVGSLDNPRLDIEAVRANTDQRVGVRVGGNVQSPRLRLFSVPELPDTDKLALLVTGRSYDSLAGADTLLLQRAAFALLAGDGSDTSAFDVARLLQLDELSVRQTDGAVRDTVVTLGKQISDRVYLGYERGLNAAAGNWQLIYRIAQRFTLRAQSGEDPAVDLIWIFRWN